MAKRSRPTICALLACLTGFSAATGQEPVVTLLPRPDLAPGFAALPRLGDAMPAAARINADLARIDARALEGSGDCRAGERSDWARWVTRDFSGPEFLGLSEGNDFYCDGAAHPDQFQHRYTWDLATGAPVDWTALLPASLGLAPAYPMGRRRSDADPYASAALVRLYVAHIPGARDPECTHFAQDPHLSFTFALNATDHALAMFPAGYAYVDRPCADMAMIPADTLQRLGAAPRLTQALLAAVPSPARNSTGRRVP